MPRRVGGESDRVPHELRSWRKGKRMTQAQLADRAGTTKATISRTENGKQALTNPAARRYADIFETHYTAIFSRPPTPDECTPFPPRPPKGAGAKRQEAHQDQQRRRKRKKLLGS